MSKKTLLLTTILTITLIVVSGCVKNKQSDIENESTVVVEKDDKQEEVVKEVKQEDSNAKYQGETIKEADGWKKYRNEYFGIEFRFRDEGDKLEVYSSRNEINLVDRNWRNISEGGPYIYIEIYNYHSYLLDVRYNYIVILV